jgi:hypothetical protein
MVYRATLCLILVLSPLSFAGEVEIMKVEDMYQILHQNMPRNLCSVVNDADITLLSSSGTQLQGDPYCLIDPDRASGIVFPSNSSQTFLLNLKSISQLKKLTLTGDINGARVHVEVMDKPTINEITWKTLISDQSLHSPVTTIVLRPQEAFQAKVTIMTGSTPIILNDIGFFSNQDMRQVELQKNPNLTVKQTAQGFKVEEPPALPDDPKEMGSLSSVVKQPQTQFDLGSLYAGARVSHITPLADVRETYHMNDDDVETYMDLPEEMSESIAVLDLGESRRVRELTMIHSDPNVEMVVYVVDRLPWSESPESVQATDVSWMEDPMWTANGWMSDVPLFAQLKPSEAPKTGKMMKVDTAIFSSIKPFASVSLAGKKFSRLKGVSTKGRFIILLFKKKNLNSGSAKLPVANQKPNENAAVAKDVNITDVASLLALDSKIRVFQVSVFGDVPINYFTFTPKARVDPTLDALITPSTQPEGLVSADESPIDVSKVDEIADVPLPGPISGSGP